MVVTNVSVEVLKLQLSMPNAHFHIIHSSGPQKTYPLPPYSTVIGFLANILGNKELIETMLGGGLVLGMLSQYKYVTREYTWLRNLLRSEHDKRFGSTNNRLRQEMPEHIGGQSPVSIEVLNDVHLVLYIYHSDLDLLEMIQQNINVPEKWYSHLHLGRAEDWVIVNSASTISLTVSNNPANLRNADQYYQWMPETGSAFGIGIYIDKKHYDELLYRVQGPATLVTSIYNLVNMPFQKKTGKKVKVKNVTIRNFDHIATRLFCSPVPFLGDFTLPAVFVDPGLNVPVYMANIGKKMVVERGTDYAK